MDLGSEMYYYDEETARLEVELSAFTTQGLSSNRIQNAVEQAGVASGVVIQVRFPPELLAQYVFHYHCTVVTFPESA